DRVKILDFGLAREIDNEENLTRSDHIIGTLSYMSPEQADGEDLDHRCDLFSLGCVLYQMCTGRLPFAGKTTFAKLKALAAQEVEPVTRLNPDVPAQLEMLINRLLVKDRTYRPATAQEVVELLESMTEEAIYQEHGRCLSTEILSTKTRDAVRPPPALPRRGHWHWLNAACSLLLVAATVLGGITFFTRNKDTRVSVEMDVDLVDPNLAFTMDGKPVTADNLRQPMELKPGSHELIVTRGGASEVYTLEVLGGNRAAMVVSKRTVGPSEQDLAKWALSVNGNPVLRIRIGDKVLTIRDPKQIPTTPFELVGMDLVHCVKVVDADLKRLQSCKSLTELSLNATGITDSGLKLLSGLPHLKSLDLTNTKIGDGGFAYLKKLPALRSLCLFG